MGLPSSSSHALVGGLIGTGLAKAGPAAVVWSESGSHRLGNHFVAVDRLVYYSKPQVS